ncbi:FKBP-type peptidyl-prolyl cis-trans isomerase [Micromonospora aurantiaca (nom. illeg.)]|uniref:FKBP-type peptidyl-prolyl cis-trans isomerase n=1 Tax=Micromonospora aurantiaca (nom. illeg.) TaxID=47850 RepID=UPI0001BF0F7E|nr:FKBP-type peptidyl-prolyl cis-trans isomerase [Micromonospora aurantiaca]ADL44048.1 peptidylprolyl isomerase FKBP-type [Micromonospora aurantiaca ATCC 27029]
MGTLGLRAGTVCAGLGGGPPGAHPPTLQGVDVSERVENRSAGQAPATKAQRRLAAQLAEKKAAEARRRRQSILGAAVGVLAVVALVGGLVWLNSGDDDKTSTAGSSASPTAPAEPTAAPAPELPAGFDPALKTKPTVQAGTGELTKLTVTTLVKGTGPAVKAGQNITTNYVGVFYKDGKQFDASWDSGQPATFQIGVGQVIKGWDQGLVGVPVGSRVQLDLPAELAYGNDAAGGRPAGPLRFVVDVLAAQ